MTAHTSIVTPSVTRRREVSQGYACDVSGLLHGSPGLTLRDLPRRLGWRSRRVRAALDSALQLGIIRVQEPGRMERWHTYYHATPEPTPPAPIAPHNPPGRKPQPPAPLKLEALLRLIRRRKDTPVTVSYLCRTLRWGAPHVHMALSEAMAQGKVIEIPRQPPAMPFTRYAPAPRKAPTP